MIGTRMHGVLRDSDWLMFGLIVAILCIGSVQVYSSTVNTANHGIHLQHILVAGLGLAVFWAFSYVRCRVLVRLVPGLWVAGTLMLVAVLLFAEPVNGARRWLTTPFGFTIQVSEFMKLVILLVGARYCTSFLSGEWQLRPVVAAGLLFTVPVLLVARQPDLGTALSMTPVLGLPVLLSRIRPRTLLGVVLAVVLLVPLMWLTLEPYQKSRITGFLDPEAQPQGSGYQIRQAKIAVGSGGIWGQGFVQGSQTQLRFLPTAHTDYVLASFAEERGFVGVTIVLGLYFGLFRRIVRTGRQTADPEGTLLAFGVALLLLFHCTVNVGMVANKLPVTGLPLPLMSYGGSSMLTFMAMLGIVNSVHIRRFVN